MFYVEIIGEYGDVTNSYPVKSSLIDAIEAVKDEVKNGVGLDNVKLYKEVELVFTIDVQVKD